MQVAFFNRQRSFLFSHEKVVSLVKAVITFEGFLCDEVAIHFIGTKRMQQLHGLYFNDFSLTDCISFPIAESMGYRALGDVFVCPQVAFTYAAAHGEDPYREVSLYVIHGLLHLMGYDDITKADQKKMRAAEARLMDHLEKRALILQPLTL